MNLMPDSKAHKAPSRSHVALAGSVLCRIILLKAEVFAMRVSRAPASPDHQSLLAQVVTTISQGKVVWDGTELHVNEGAGRFIECPAFGSLYDGLDVQDSRYLRNKFPYGDIPVSRNLHSVKASKSEL